MEEDLWNTLEYQAAVDGVILPESLVKIMGSWTQTNNYPLVTITRDYTGRDGALVEQVCPLSLSLILKHHMAYYYSLCARI